MVAQTNTRAEDYKVVFEGVCNKGKSMHTNKNVPNLPDVVQGFTTLRGARLATNSSLQFSAHQATIFRHVQHSVSIS